MPTLTLDAGALLDGVALESELLLPQAASANDAAARTEASFTPFNTKSSSLNGRRLPHCLCEV
jgi:hypothetical protein